jgi:FemAB-related protein (PEP-CTERM system-associated)
VNYGGVVANDTIVASALLRHAAEVAREQGLAHVELRHRSRMFEALPARQHKVAMILPLEPSAERIWTGLDRKVRNQVRKAEKSGLVVESGGRELLPAFYRVFAENMRDLGTPVYSRRLFDEVFAQYPESARVFCVQRDSRTTIAAGIAYRHRDGVEVPWASSLSRYRALCPNNLLYWRVIEWAVGLGLRFLDFGRSTPDGGTYHFKRQWGAVPHPLAWEYALVSRTTVPDQGPTNPRFDRAIALWKKLPVWASTTLGPPIVRSIP